MPAARKNAITDKMARFICEDMRPIGIVSGEGMRDLVMELEPNVLGCCRGCCLSFHICLKFFFKKLTALVYMRVLWTLI